jgi:hypothetical protein
MQFIDEVVRRLPFRVSGVNEQATGSSEWDIQGHPSRSIMPTIDTDLIAKFAKIAD